MLPALRHLVSWFRAGERVRRHIGLKCIADAVNGAEEIGQAAPFQFGTEAAYMDVDGPRSDVVVAPHGMEQLLSPQHDCRVPHEIDQQIKLLGLQGHRLTVGHFSALAGGLGLGLLTFPTVTRATEETIKLVPSSIREAALALGIPEWKTMFSVILPAATNGVVTAIMLGIARVAGETAPLVFTTFGNDAFPGSPLHETGVLPLKMGVYATGPYATWHAQAWTGALILFALIVVLNLTARLLTFRLSRRVALS
jgi:hypothetical protein